MIRKNLFVPIRKIWRDGKSQQIAYLLIAVMSVLGLLLSLSIRFSLWYRVGTPARIDERYAKLKASLPSFSHLGYISDLPLHDEVGLSHYYQAQYALAPNILTDDLTSTYIVGNFLDPSRLPLICAQHSLQPILVFDNGVALLKRESNP